MDGQVLERRRTLAPGWTGEVYGAQVAAPPGWIVSVGWHRVDRSFVVGVWHDDDDEPVYFAGGEDDDPLETVGDLLAAAAACQVGPFAGRGCVDWTREPGLLAALDSVADAGRSAPGAGAARQTWRRRRA